MSRAVAVVGAGTIGLSWAALFSSRGLSVRVNDPRPDVQDLLEATAAELAGTLGDDLMARIVVEPDLEAAVTGAEVVQETGPERIELKQELFARFEAAAPPDALLLSSTSGLMPSDMGARMKEPGRAVVGHPFNPPHVVPLVEVVPGARTPEATVQAAVGFYRSLGKVPVVLHKEIGGFVANRLQSALFRESVNLVLQGVVTAEELDQVVTESVGVRWATAGPFESYHLGGGPGGIRHLLEHLGPGMARRWQDLGQPELTPQVVEQISSQTEARFAHTDYATRTAERDRLQLAVLAAREQARHASGPPGS